MSSKKNTFSMVLYLLGLQLSLSRAEGVEKDFKPVSWSVEYSPEISTTANPKVRSSSSTLDQETVKYDNPEGSGNANRQTSTQDGFFDAQREIHSRATLDNQWTASGSTSGSQLNDQNQPFTTKSSLSYQIPSAPNNTWSSQISAYENNAGGDSFPYSTLQPPSSTSHLYDSLNQLTPVDGRTSTRLPLDFYRPSVLIAGANPMSVGSAHNYITRDTVARHLAGAPLWQSLSQELMHRTNAIKGDHLTSPLVDQQQQQQLSLLARQPQQQQSARQASAKTTTWLKTFGAKRRSFEPPASDSHRLSSVSFDDNVETIRVREPDQSGTQLRAAPRDYLTSYSTMPLVYDLPPSALTAPSMERKNMKISYADDDHYGTVDHLLSGSKSIGHSMPAAFYPAYPTYTATTAHVAPRKGLEKALGVPILVGIGAALISFLIISNLFLSVPLFAMTLLQLINGSANLMPNNNNNMPPNNNNMNNGNGGGGGQNGGGQTTNGRKRRDLDLDLHENDIKRRFEKAIDGLS